MWLNFVELVVLCYMFPSKAGGINGVELKCQKAGSWKQFELERFWCDDSFCGESTFVCYARKDVNRVDEREAEKLENVKFKVVTYYKY